MSWGNLDSRGQTATSYWEILVAKEICCTDHCLEALPTGRSKCDEHFGAVQVLAFEEHDKAMCMSVIRRKSKRRGKAGTFHRL